MRVCWTSHFSEDLSGVFRAQDSGQLHVYANPTENETLSPTFQVQAALQDCIKTIRLVHLVFTPPGRTVSRTGPVWALYFQCWDWGPHFASCFVYQSLCYTVDYTVVLWRHAFWDLYCVLYFTFYPSVLFYISRNLETNSCYDDGIRGSIYLTSWLFYTLPVIFYSYESTSQNSFKFGFKGWKNFKWMSSQHPNPYNKWEYFLQSLSVHRVHMIYLSGTARLQLSERVSILFAVHKMCPQVHLALSKSLSFRGWQDFKDKILLWIDNSVPSLSHASVCMSKTCLWEAGSKAWNREKKRLQNLYGLYCSMSSAEPKTNSRAFQLNQCRWTLLWPLQLQWPCSGWSFQSDKGWDGMNYLTFLSRSSSSFPNSSGNSSLHFSGGCFQICVVLLPFLSKDHIPKQVFMTLWVRNVSDISISDILPLS